MPSRTKVAVIWATSIVLFVLLLARLFRVLKSLGSPFSELLVLGLRFDLYSIVLWLKTFRIATIDPLNSPPLFPTLRSYNALRPKRPIYVRLGKLEASAFTPLKVTFRWP